MGYANLEKTAIPVHLIVQKVLYVEHPVETVSVKLVMEKISLHVPMIADEMKLPISAVVYFTHAIRVVLWVILCALIYRAEQIHRAAVMAYVRRGKTSRRAKLIVQYEGKVKFPDTMKLR